MIVMVPTYRDLTDPDERKEEKKSLGKNGAYLIITDFTVREEEVRRNRRKE